MPDPYALLAEALDRMAAEEERRAMGWLAIWTGGLLTVRHWGFSAAANWAAECLARREIYLDWATALRFPGGPVHADVIRYGCPRASLAGPELARGSDGVD